MGWTFPWASSRGSDFNADYSVWFTQAQQREGAVDYNYRREAPLAAREGEPSAASADDPVAAMCGTDSVTFQRDRPGMSAFAIQDGAIHHTYSAYARGLDILWGAYQWLDRAPKGRNEMGTWWRRHDEYSEERRERP